MTEYSISFKAKYKNTTFERPYEFTDVPEEAATISVVRNKIDAINASLAGGQASALANLFVSDDYDSLNNIGTLENINTVKIKAVDITNIPQTSSRRIAEEPTTEETQQDFDPGEINEPIPNETDDERR